MDVEQMERELRKQLEAHVGRPLTDHEWETFKGIQAQSAKGARSEGARAWQWTRLEKAACFVALVAALAGAGLLFEFGFVFSPFVRVPLGALGLLMVPLGAVLVLAMFVNAFRRGSGMDWLERLFAILMLPFISVPLLVGLATGGFALTVEDREYLTSAYSDWRTSLAQLVGGAFILGGIFLAVAGLPSRVNHR